MSDFMVCFSTFDQNTVKLVGRKNLFLSQVAQMNREKSFHDVFFTPYFTNSGQIKGVRLILLKENYSDEQKLSIENITIKDQDINNIFHQQTDLAQFGHQKFLINTDCHDEYLLLVSAQLR